MMDYDVDFRIDTFPSSDKFRIFRVVNNCIWVVAGVPAFNIDTGYIEFYDLFYDDIVTAEIICDMINESEAKLNG